MKKGEEQQQSREESIVGKRNKALSRDEQTRKEEPNFLRSK